jgi:hypothetical protein
MITKNGHIMCDGCGHFVGTSDLVNGNATHYLVTPDAHFSSETWESLCPVCVAAQTAHARSPQESGR